ncbi:MAG: hypothetical protein JWM42_804 [Burkholderia sp.]|nr:hypothetical protein [Burkholderia sp.]
MDQSRSELPEILQMYGRQCLHIDEGAAAAWADTFTADGRFDSPSYPEPVEGRDDLVAFAERFAASSAGNRHVVTNAHIVSAPSSNERAVRAYLLIVRTRTSGEVEILRLTTINDDLVRTNGQWRIRSRRVTLNSR